MVCPLSGAQRFWYLIHVHVGLKICCNGDDPLWLCLGTDRSSLTWKSIRASELLGKGRTRDGRARAARVEGPESVDGIAAGTPVALEMEGDPCDDDGHFRDRRFGQLQLYISIDDLLSLCIPCNYLLNLFFLLSYINLPLSNCQ